MLYDVANSAFATTVLAAVFPVFYASVAGATLPSAATATQYYSLTLSVSVLLLAGASPVLGTFADVTGAKLRLLGLFAAVGVIATGLLATIGPGDWLAASLLFAVGRIGFGGANVFYDALLVHIARPGDLDRVSTRGFAFGYLGGGVLLAVNIGMILVLGELTGTRLALLSVALWWGALSVPLLRSADEPPPTVRLSASQTAWSVTRERLRTVIGDLRTAVDLRRYLVAYLVGNDAIGTVISLAAIYATELGIGAVETVGALLLVQFAGMAFSLLFGRLPERQRPQQPAIAAFIIGVLVALPATGLLARAVLPPGVTGLAPDGADVEAGALATVPAPGDDVEVVGRRVEVVYAAQPGGGRLEVLVDGTTGRTPDGEPAAVETDAATRGDETLVVDAGSAGSHTLGLRADGTVDIRGVEVLPAVRSSSLPVIAALLAAVVAVVGLAASTVGRRLVAPLARRLDTKACIVLAFTAYAAISAWGFVLDSVLEFWFLALAVAVVQGGSQALTRSLYAVLIPESASGEYFGFFSVLSKLASVLSPLLFVVSVALFDTSRPAVLSLVVLFAVAIGLLTRVDVHRGRALAAEREEALRRAARGAPGVA